MYKLTRILFVFVLLTSFTLVTAQPSYACSCMMSPAPAQAMTESEAVFQGRATQVPPSGDMMGSVDPLMVTFEVSQVWKGPVEPVMTIRTAASSASCGYTFEEGQEYVVYGRAVDGWLEASLCSRTAPLANAAEDIAALGEGQIPVAAPVEVVSEESGSSSLPRWGLGAVILVGAIVAGVLLQRRS
ncbi:MAG: hypothetical protein H0T73_14890 [Ardenticatenales bacterium]|nr:hypothetical protein [Ardenticatenales bacterium]